MFASPHDAGTAFVSKTGFRQDILRPFLFKTSDYGETWAAIAGDLPAKNINGAVQDHKNAGLLFAGTDFGLYVSLNGGRNWSPLKGIIPSVKMTDLVIHPRENDLVVATYGRGIYVADVTLFQEWDDSILGEDVHLFNIEPRVQRRAGAIGNYQLQGDSHLTTPNEPDDVVIRYYLKDEIQDKVKITISDLSGKVLDEIEGKSQAGLNTAAWDMRPKREGEPGVEDGEWGSRRNSLIEPGEYTVTLEAGGKKLTRKALIRKRQGWAVGPFPVIIQ